MNEYVVRFGFESDVSVVIVIIYILRRMRDANIKDKPYAGGDCVSFQVGRLHFGDVWRAILAYTTRRMGSL